MSTSLLDALGELAHHDKLSVEQAKTLIEQSPHEEIRFYLQSMILGSKPENAIDGLLRAVIFPIAGRNIQFEGALGSGFIDILFHERRHNPVLMELKPLFVAIRQDKKITSLKYKPISFKSHAEQIKKYLRDNDYLILTNAREAYLFNRDIFIQEDIEPFASLNFHELLLEYRETLSLWDIMRRLDGQQPRPALEREFFLDLERWHSALQEVSFSENPPLPVEELGVLFLNKVIFIKTLEDHALIPFNFLLDTYTALEERWRVKGPPFIFMEFFNSIEKWCWQYYDTELFQINFWEVLDHSREALNQFKAIFEKVIGTGKWERSFGKGMVHYDYRKIDEDVFGKAYETFIAKQRKDSGIYYTHRLITRYMAERLAQQLFAGLVEQVCVALDNNALDQARAGMDKIRKIRVADTCAGSGSFLIKVLREIYAQYQRIEEKTGWVKGLAQDGLFSKPAHVLAIENFRKAYFFDDDRRLLASIMLYHIHAIDIDGRALDTAKTNLWKEAVKLNSQAFHYSRLPGELNHILPNLTLNCIEGDALLDLPLREQVDFLADRHSADIAKLQMLRQAYLDNPTHPQTLDKIPALKAELRAILLAQAQDELFKSLLPRRKPILLALEFFYLFFDQQGQPLPEDEWGFSGIISNPPWEVLKAFQKEFANQRINEEQDRINKYSFEIVSFDKWFKDRLSEDNIFKQEWEKYVGFYESYNKYLRDRYEYQGIGDLNYYKLLVERDLSLLGQNGILNILIPSGIQTDKGCLELRRLLIENNHLNELYSFENRGFKENPEDKYQSKIFPDVDNRFKFSVVNVTKEDCDSSRSHALRGNEESPLCGDAPQSGAVAFPRGAWERDAYYFNALFYLHDPRDLYTAQPIRISADMIAHFSPQTFSIMEFSSEKNYEICVKIRGAHPLLSETGVKLRTEFHLTNDSKLFHKKSGKNTLALYEGKHIYQYNSNLSPRRYFLDRDQAHGVLLDKEVRRLNKECGTEINREEFIAQGFKLDYECWKLVYRDVASSTNELTLIATLLPPHVLTGNTLNHFVPFNYDCEGSPAQAKIHESNWLFLLALFNSLALNFYIRNKITAHTGFYYVYELPIPACPPDLKSKIIEKAFILLSLKNPLEWYEPLRLQLGLPEIDRFQPNLSLDTRAELEILIARDIYGLNAEEWAYLTSTFIYGGESDTKQELDKIIALSRERFSGPMVIP